MNTKQPQPPPDHPPTSKPVIPPPPPPKIRNPGRESLDHAVARLAAQVAGLKDEKEIMQNIVRTQKARIELLRKLVNIAIDNLDPEMRGNDIRWLRDLLIERIEREEK